MTFPILLFLTRTVTVKLFEHQTLAISQLKTGSVLQGGVGSGKSITSIAYYYKVECENMTKPKDLYIITTARKRDTLDWERECMGFNLSRERDASVGGVRVTVDSWNNIAKYVECEGFFIFDEQRVVGSGAWVKSFLKITKKNNWILLSATPGDVWLDYVPVFIANGFYKNVTEFKRAHVVYNTFTKYPKVDHYVEQGKLIRLRNQITVMMTYSKLTRPHMINILVAYDLAKYEKVVKKRWNPFKEEPIKEVGEFFHLMRRVVNSDPSRVDAVRVLLEKHSKVIVFYNFNYELDLLRELKSEIPFELAEYNGHRHEAIPKSDNWVYLVQYISGAEGWNCIDTDTIIFYSQNYSYRLMTQAAGRIDRLNTPFENLYYYTLKSSASIDLGIFKALTSKKNFNEKNFSSRQEQWV
jgi:hypothetical protein